MPFKKSLTLKAVMAITMLLSYWLLSVPVYAQKNTNDPTKPPLSAQHGGFTIQLSAITPDRIRAFFTGRGFPAKMVETIAGYCVISTKIENIGEQAFSYDLSKWRYETPDGIFHKLKIKDDWIKEWREQGIKFSFSQLAANPTFLPGDWIASMTTYKLPPGSSFTLHYQWSVNNKDNTGSISGVKCAND